MIYFYTDRTVYRIVGPGEWHTVEASIGGVWTDVTPSENDLAHMREITEEQAEKLIALPAAERVMPTA